MIARCDGCDTRREGHNYLTVIGHRYDPRRRPLAQHRCGDCGGLLRAKRKGETESCIVSAILLPDLLDASYAYQRGVTYGLTHPTGSAYVPTSMRDAQQRAEYLVGVSEGRRRRGVRPKRRAGDVARERKKQHASATD